MTLHGILDEAVRRQIVLWVEDGRLRYKCPDGALTPDLQQLIVSHKSALISHLANAESRGSADSALSQNQLALWFEYQKAPASAAYNVAFVARIRSAVDIAKLEHAIQCVVDRHAMLRSTYLASGGVPKMRFSRSQLVRLQRHDASTLSHSQLRSAVREAYARPFDLENGPVIRADLFHVSATDCVWLLNVHHIAIDAWSLNVIVSEIVDRYSNVHAGDQGNPLDYRDFTTRQKQLLASAPGVEHLRYWTGRLADLPAELDLPVDKVAAPARAGDGYTHHFRLPADLHALVEARAKETGATTYTFLLAAFEVILMRYTGETDLVIAAPMTCRATADDRAVGCCINTVLLRDRVLQDVAFSGHLMQTRQTVAEALAHRSCPLPVVVKGLGPTRSASRAPIFRVMFNLLNRKTLGSITDFLYRSETGIAPDEIYGIGSLQLQPFPLSQGEGQCDLHLEIIDTGQGFNAALRGAANAFLPDTLERLAKNSGDSVARNSRKYGDNVQPAARSV